jgi:hypothetical protein
MTRTRHGRRRFVSGFLTALFTLVAPALTHAQQVPSEAAVKAAYLFRFAGYIEWPDGGSGDHPFVIDVMGEENVARELRHLLPGHLIGQHVVEVREVTRVQEVEGAQILYVGPGHDEFLRAIRPRESEPILVVTDEEQGLDRGAMLNFLIVDKHVRFEVSLTAAEHAHLKISAELLSVAIRVHNGGRQSEKLCFPLWLPPDTDSRCQVREARLGPLRQRRATSGAAWLDA